MVQALGGYAEANVWLIVAAVFFSRGIINSGLGKRIAYTLIRAFGTSSLKLAYALACTDLIISPATPSNTARGGGIIFQSSKIFPLPLTLSLMAIQHVA